MREKRKYERLPLTLWGKIEGVTLGEQKVLHVLTSNVSAGGVLLHTTQPFAEDTHVKLKLIIASRSVEEFTGARGLLEVGGTVVRSSPEGTAVSFDEEYELMRKPLS